MRRRTYLTLAIGFAGGVGARHAVGPIQDQLGERALQTSESVLATDFETDNAEHLQLPPTDFPNTGWEFFGETDEEASADSVEDVEADGAPSNSSEALFYNYDSGAIVLTVVALAASADEARTAYDSIREGHAAQYSLAEDLGIAVDEHAYRTEASFVVFRVRNAVGIVGHEPSETQPTVDDAVEIADLLVSTWGEE